MKKFLSVVCALVMVLGLMSVTAYAAELTDGVFEGTGKSFGGDLKVLVGFNQEGNILGYTILQTAETPGLGAKAEGWFQKDVKGSIIGKNPSTDNLIVSKDGGSVNAITASTITSRAFLLAVNNAYNAYKKGADSNSGATKVNNNLTNK